VPNSCMCDEWYSDTWLGCTKDSIVDLGDKCEDWALNKLADIVTFQDGLGDESGGDGGQVPAFCIINKRFTF
jgi:hypothetical protein